MAENYIIELKNIAEKIFPESKNEWRWKRGKKRRKHKSERQETQQCRYIYSRKRWLKEDIIKERIQNFPEILDCLGSKDPPISL